MLHAAVLHTPGSCCIMCPSGLLAHVAPHPRCPTLRACRIQSATCQMQMKTPLLYTRVSCTHHRKNNTAGATLHTMPGINPLGTTAVHTAMRNRGLQAIACHTTFSMLCNGFKHTPWKKVSVCYKTAAGSGPLTPSQYQSDNCPQTQPSPTTMLPTLCAN
jgi:hypothetical protein